MTQIKLSINIETQKELSLNDIYIIMQDFKARLEGYVTEVPEQLKNVTINIDENYSIDNIEKNIFTEIKKTKN